MKAAIAGVTCGGEGLIVTCLIALASAAGGYGGILFRRDLMLGIGTIRGLDFLVRILSLVAILVFCLLTGLYVILAERLRGERAASEGKDPSGP